MRRHDTLRSDARGTLQPPAVFPLWIAVIAVGIFAGPNLWVLVSGSLPNIGAEPDGEFTASVAAIVLTVLVQLAIFGLALLPLALSRTPVKAAFGTAKRSVLSTGLGLVLGVAVTVTVFIVNAVVIGLFGDSTPVEQSLLPSPSDSPATILILAFMVIVVAPVTEEIMFRGVFFGALRRHVGVHLAALLSAVVFAVVHVEVIASQPFGLVGLTVAGLLLAYAFHLTNSLRVAIVMHAVYNAVAFGLMLLVTGLEGMGLPV